MPKVKLNSQKRQGKLRTRSSKKRIKVSYSGKQYTSDGFVYLTKRTLISKARAAGKKAANAAMMEMGYVITAKNGWIVKKYADGRVKRLNQI